MDTKIPHVTTGLNFIQPEFMGTPTPVKIYDARFSPKSFSLEANGFTMFEHRTSISREEFYNDTLVAETYYPEIAEGLKNLLGATHAFPVTHRIRNGDQNFFFASTRRSSNGSGCIGAGSGRKNEAVNQSCKVLAEYVPLVHCDNTFYQGKEMVQDFLRLNGAHQLLDNFESHRYKIVNVWRNIRDDPISASNHPLCLLDAATMRVPSDFVQTVTELPKLDYHKSYHRWWWYSNLTRDEMLVFSRWDSRGTAAASLIDAKSGKPKRCVGLPGDRLSISTFHSAFQVENKDFTKYLDSYATSGRESIDCICILVW